MQRRVLLFICSAIFGCYSPHAVDDESSADTDGASTSAGSTTGSESGGTTVGDSVDSTGSESGAGSTGSEPTACEVDRDCTDPLAPFCDGESCVGCDALEENACEALNPETPICSGGACVACTEHDQCATGVCRIATGACFPGPNRLWVDNTLTVGQCGSATGEESAPFCTLGEAQSVVSQQPGSEPWAIFVAGSATAYTDGIDNDGRVVAVIGPDQGLAARVEPASGYPAWISGGELYLAHLDLHFGDNGSNAIECASGDVWVTDSAVAGGLDTNVCMAEVRRSDISLGLVAVDNIGRGIRVGSGGTLVMMDSQVRDSDGAMYVAGSASVVRSLLRADDTGGGPTLEVTGTVDAVNSMFYGNPYSSNVLAQPGSNVDLLYTTIDTNFNGYGLDCMSADVTVRNSIVLAANCSSAAIDHSAVGNDGALTQGSGNAVLPDTVWEDVFVGSTSYPSDDLHVMPGAPVITDLAQWMQGDPTQDIDGDARPMRDGAPDVAGADIP